MQNITLENLLDAAAARNQIKWPEIVSLSRLDAQQHSVYKRIVVWAGNEKKKAVSDMTEYLRSIGFTTFKTDNFTHHALLEDKESKCIRSHIEYWSSDVTLIALYTGEDKLMHEIKKWIDERHPQIGSIIHTATHYDESSKRVQMDRTYMVPGEVNKANQEFYPWLNVPLNDYFDAFMAAPEPVLVLFGPPGGGKSTFIRSLITHRNYEAILAYNAEVVVRPQLLRQFMSSTKANILAYEDIDRFLSSREDGNDLMSSLLNASEGVIQHPGKKIIFSTNLPSIDRIDEALLRVGRCFDILKFEKLTADQAAAARASKPELAPREFQEGKTYSLSEALSTNGSAIQTINRFANGIGFK